MTMRLFLFAALGALLLAAASDAWAGKYVDGNNLFAAVKGGTAAQRSYAMGFVLGANDALDGSLVCAPPEVKIEQLMDLVSAYLRDNPAKRHRHAVDLVYLALADEYPCSRNP